MILYHFFSVSLFLPFSLLPNQHQCSLSLSPSALHLSLVLSCSPPLFPCHSLFLKHSLYPYLHPTLSHLSSFPFGLSLSLSSSLSPSLPLSLPLFLSLSPYLSLHLPPLLPFIHLFVSLLPFICMSHSLPLALFLSPFLPLPLQFLLVYRTSSSRFESKTCNYCCKLIFPAASPWPRHKHYYFITKALRSGLDGMSSARSNNQQ